MAQLANEFTAPKFVVNIVCHAFVQLFLILIWFLLSAGEQARRRRRSRCPGRPRGTGRRHRGRIPGRRRRFGRWARTWTRRGRLSSAKEEEKEASTWAGNTKEARATTSHQKRSGYYGREQTYGASWEKKEEKWARRESREGHGGTHYIALKSIFLSLRSPSKGLLKLNVDLN